MFARGFNPNLVFTDELPIEDLIWSELPLKEVPLSSGMMVGWADKV